MTTDLTVDRGLRGVAGFLILLSLALGYWAHPAFFLFTAFVGANLLQSAFTDSCPMMGILRRLGLRDVRDLRKPAGLTAAHR